MEFINKKKYEELLNHYLAGIILQGLVRDHTNAIMSILGKDREVAGDSIVDVIYSPTSKISEDDFKELLLKNNVQVDWTSISEGENEPEFETEKKLGTKNNQGKKLPK